MQLHRDQKYVLRQSDWDAWICDFECKKNLCSVKLLLVRRYHYWLILLLVEKSGYDNISGVSGIPEAFVCWVGWEVVGVSAVEFGGATTSQHWQTTPPGRKSLPSPQQKDHRGGNWEGLVSNSSFLHNKTIQKNQLSWSLFRSLLKIQRS